MFVVGDLVGDSECGHGVLALQVALLLRHTTVAEKSPIRPEERRIAKAVKRNASVLVCWLQECARSF